MKRKGKRLFRKFIKSVLMGGKCAQVKDQCTAVMCCHNNRTFCHAVPYTCTKFPTPSVSCVNTTDATNKVYRNLYSERTFGRTRRSWEKQTTLNVSGKRRFIAKLLPETRCCFFFSVS